MAVRRLRIRWADNCSTCRTHLPAGTNAEWNVRSREITCLRCVARRRVTHRSGARQHGDAGVGSNKDSYPSELRGRVTVEDFAISPLDIGIPGGSAAQEHQRRRTKHYAAVETRWGTGFFGRLAKSLSEPPQHTKSWRIGAVGEARVAQVLQSRLGESAVVLHDRRVNGSRGNIDHIAISHSGVWVVDTKNYQGRVEQRNKGSKQQPSYRLYVRGWDKTDLIEKMEWQWRAVSESLTNTVNVPVYCVVAFVNAEWPPRQGPYIFGQVLVTWPENLADYIAQPGPLSAADVRAISATLAKRFPSTRSK